MHLIEYRIKTLSPVLISSNSGDSNMTGCMDYFTGKTVLGALAGSYIKKYNLKNAHEDPVFARWFIFGDLLFSHAYPVIKEHNQEMVFFPASLALRVGKEDGRIYNRSLGKMSKSVPTKAISGLISIRDKQIKTLHPEKQLNFHHARTDRIKGRSMDSEIFNYESLVEGQTYAGTIMGSEKNLEQIKMVFGKKLRLQMGRSRSVQYGHVELEFGQMTAFSIPRQDHSDKVTVSLISPAILLNEYGYGEVSRKILETYLQEALGVSELKIDKFFARVERIESFVSVWRLKTPGEAALAAGTTFTIVFPGGLTRELEEKLRDLVYHGLGERLNEGFGRLKLNQFTQKDYFQEDVNKPQEIHKPVGEMPEFLRKCLKDVIDETLTRHVKQEAYKMAKEFHEKSSQRSRVLGNSTIGRLELMVRSAKSPSVFVNSLQDLKNIAVDKLSNYRNSNITLWEMLHNIEVVHQVVRERMSKKLTDLARETGFQLDDTDLQNRLFDTFWLSFFRSTRKMNKEEEINHEA